MPCLISKLYTDPDASKKRGFGAMVYHYSDRENATDTPRRLTIQPILFLSKLLNNAEKTYLKDHV